MGICLFLESLLMATFLDNLLTNLSDGGTWWTIFGFIAQFVFASRFAVQWYASEKLKRSVIPVEFWWLSVIGGALNLVYTIHVGKAPLIFGALFTTVVPIRNLMLIYGKKKPSAPAKGPE